VLYIIAVIAFISQGDMDFGRHHRYRD
jgi:hypothetical protein